MEKQKKGNLPATDVFPFRPATPPIDWRGLADRLLRYLIGRPEGITERNEKGNFHFTAFMEGRGHELITNGGLWMGLALRGERIDPYLPSLLDYFNEEIGIFMNGEKDTQSEYWYLMLVNALAAQLVKHSFQGNKNAVDKVRLSLKRIMKLAQDVNYDFNDQGYDFANGKPFTLREEYRQPDAIGGYAYLMELGFELFHDLEFREEALRAIHLYQSFERNPWYEIPSQAMACLAAAHLYAQGEEINLEKILRFALDFEEGSLLVGVWGHQEIYGLMRGWRGFSRQESSRMAYSLESFILLPYLLPVVRYEPRFAEAIASYALHLSANARLFFSDFMKDKAQSRPDLGVEIPYEALHREEKGEIPYATGDFYGHRSIYGGAYTLWLGELIQPTDDPYILKLDVVKTDFLENRTFPTYLYFNPWEEKKSILVGTEGEVFDLYDLKDHRYIAKGQKGECRLEILPRSARVIVLIPAGVNRVEEVDGKRIINGVVIDYLNGREPE